MGRLTDTIKHLLIINALFFIAAALYPDLTRSWLALWFPEHENFQWWQIVTHMFMHGGIMHIVFNMYALYAFGTPLEQMWGKKKFLFFYFSAGLGSALLHTLMNYYGFSQGVDALVNAGFDKNQIMELVSTGRYMESWSQTLSPDGLMDFAGSYAVPAVGASGAIYGILVAFAFSFPEAELMLIFLPVPIKAKFFVPVLIGLDLFSGFTGYSLFGQSIAHFAHVGGAIAGFVMMWYWKKNSFNKNRWD
ncbi:MAG: rhomboid family intramembrane serine protease [Maribacter sp.]